MTNDERFDRRTALRVLQDLSTNMRPRLDLFGKKILTIGRDEFEEVRKKYLDGSNERDMTKTSPDVIYICDEEACEECQIDDEGRCCYHTSDIRHAANFEEVCPGCWAEKVGPKDDKDARIQELEKEVQELRGLVGVGGLIFL